MIRKFIFALIFILPSLAFAVDLEGFYITAKGGVSKTLDTGTMNYDNGQVFTLNDDDLGTGSAFGISAGKYITDNFRLELEAIKRTGYEMDTTDSDNNLMEANITSKSIFINGFYDFQPFSLGNTPITPYLGGGVGISKNKMGATHENRPGNTVDGKTISQFAYKVAAGTLVDLTENVSLDINYQYVNLGNFKSGVGVYDQNGNFQANLPAGINGGKIKTQELMVGLQYKF
jgi:opacity protein-like surface antigen